MIFGYSPKSNPMRIEADHRVIEALISNNPPLESAIADLVDNSIDAGATSIEIRIHRGDPTQTQDTSPISISVWDNGEGMSEQKLKDAVALSRVETKKAEKLGKFGVGLKAASFSNSSVTTVFSKTSKGDIYGIQLGGVVGNRVFTPISETNPGSGFTRSFAKVPDSGTIVRWENLRGLSKFTGQSEISKWVSLLENRILSHLGLVFNRFLDKPGSPLTLSVMQVDSAGGQGLKQVVRGLNPSLFDGQLLEAFRLTGEFEAEPLDMKLWMSKKGHTDKQLQWATGSPNGSGLYIYRNNRLVQSGKWSNLVEVGSHDYRLLRVEIEIPVSFEKSGSFIVSHDKNSCTFDDRLRDALLECSEASTKRKFRHFLSEAENRQKTKLHLEPLPPMIALPIGSSTERIRQELLNHCRPATNEIRIIHTPFPGESQEVFGLDLKSRTLQINSRLIAEEKLSLLESALIQIAFRTYTSKNALNEQDRFDLKIWNEILRSLLSESGPTSARP